MECLNCYEVYDEGAHLPLNLECGHTFCKSCVMELLQERGRTPQCSVCRRFISTHLPVDHLSKNYHALELARSLREKKGYFEFCGTHLAEPERFFCATCGKGVCASCISAHSKHYIGPQEYSPNVLRERIGQLKKWAGDESRKLGVRGATAREKLATTKAAAAKEIQRTTEMGAGLLGRLGEERDAVVKAYTQQAGQKTGELRASIKQIGGQISELVKLQAEVEALETRIREVKSSSKEQSIADIADALEAKFAGVCETLLVPPDLSESLKINLNTNYEDTLGRLAHISNESTEHTLVFFGDGPALTTYTVETKEWNSVKFRPGLRPFNFSTAHSFVDHALLFGGTSSADVLRFDYKTLDMRVVGRLQEVRSEHASVFFDNCVFVFGGYNRETNRYLSSCEVYSLEDGKSRVLPPMKTARSGHCAALTRE